MKRFLIVVLASPFFPVAGALAHAMLERANPPVGSARATAPREVVLRFTEELEPAFSQIEVRNAGGDVVSSGKARIGADRNELRVALKPLPTGNYKVIWRVLSVDTHRTQGDFSFRVGP